MNIFKRWKREAMRSRIANAAAIGFGMAHMPPYIDLIPRHDLHRAEIRAYWRGFTAGAREFRKPINVQLTLDKMNDILSRYSVDPSKKDDFADELRQVSLCSSWGSIDERHDEVYAAFEAAAGKLGIRGEPDTEFYLAEIEAEKRRSIERRGWNERVTA